MSTQIQRRRGTTAQHSTFTGAVGEVTVDTDKEVLVVHDGAQAGGYPQMRENGSNSALALGSAATPSLKFSGDTNTGIYSPGADQVAISTNGTGRLFVDSTGKVEVSKATGSATLSPTEFFISSTTDANDWNTTNPWARLAFYSADTTNGARTRVAIDAVQQFSNGNVSALSFKTDNGSGTLVERQRISYTGITTLTSAASTEPLIVKIDTSEVARIDSSGRLGLGTSTPETLLHAKTTQQFSETSGSQSAGILIEQSGGTAGNGAYSTAITLSKINSSRPGAAIASVQTSSDEDQLGLAFLTHSSSTTNSTLTEALRITHDGKLGLGTNNPGALFEVSDSVQATNSEVAIRLSTNAATVSARNEIRSGHTNNTNPYLSFAVRETASPFGVVERMRIDSSGRLLVGTTSWSSNHKLVVLGQTGNPTASGRVAIARNNFLSTADIPLGFLQFQDGDENDYASIGAYTDGTSTTGTDLPGRLVFSTTADGASSPTERMRIDSTGKVGGFDYYNGSPYRGSASYQALGHTFTRVHTIDSTSNTWSSQRSGLTAVCEGGAGGNGQTGTVALTCVIDNAGAGNTGAILRGWSGDPSGTPTLNIQIAANGNVTNTNNSYGSLSDIRLKTNIQPASSQWSDLKQLNVVNFEFADDSGYADGSKYLGLIAQEAESVSPGIVETSPDEDGIKSVKYSVLYMKAVKALQEAMERIETLEAKVAALEAQ